MPQSHRDLVGSQIEKIHAHNGFPCHTKHPTAHAMVDGPYKHTDCQGYKQMLENQKTPGKYPKIVSDWKDKWKLKM